MSLSDCPKCWDTPCTCGYEYRNYSQSAKRGLIRAILGLSKDTPMEEVIKALERIKND